MDANTVSLSIEGIDHSFEYYLSSTLSGETHIIVTIPQSLHEVLTPQVVFVYSPKAKSGFRFTYSFSSLQERELKGELAEKIYAKEKNKLGPT